MVISSNIYPLADAPLSRAFSVSVKALGFFFRQTQIETVLNGFNDTKRMKSFIDDLLIYTLCYYDMNFQTILMSKVYGKIFVTKKAGRWEQFLSHLCFR